MAKAKGKGAEPVGQSEYLSAEQVAGEFGITMQEHWALSSSPTYPKPKYGAGGSLLGYSRKECEEYLPKSHVSAPLGELEKLGVTGVEAKIDTNISANALQQITDCLHDPEPDPFVSLHPIDVPTTSEELSRCLAFSRGFSTQWTADEMLRWRKLIGGLVRQNATYIDYQDKPERRQAMVRSTIQSALKWLLRAAVPLTLEELQTIHLGQKASGDEPGVKTRE